MCYNNQGFHGNYRMQGQFNPRGAHFKRMIASMYGGGFGRGFSQVPVNAKETATAYELSIFAPARDKALFSIKVKDKILTVAYTAADDNNAPNEQWHNQEYTPTSFERQFLLNDKIDETGIKAQYTEGVLKVTLPKTAEAQRPPQEVEIQ